MRLFYRVLCRFLRRRFCAIFFGLNALVLVLFASWNFVLLPIVFPDASRGPDYVNLAKLSSTTDANPANPRNKIPAKVPPVRGKPPARPPANRGPTRPPPLSKTNEVAFLVIDNAKNDALEFVSSSRAKLQTLRPAVQNVSEIRRSVTYFVFTSSPSNFTDTAGNNSGVVTISITDDQQLNPCQVYVKFAGQYGYFDGNKFDHVLSFDPRMRVLWPINLADELLSELTATQHPGFLAFMGSNTRWLPYDRREQSCANVPVGNETSMYYGTELFGGESRRVAELCKAIVECDTGRGNDNLKEPEFHQQLNAYFAKMRKPTLTLNPSYSIPKGLASEVRMMQKINFDERRPAETQNGEAMPGDEFFRRREQCASDVVQQFRNFYFTKMAPRLTSSNANRLQFVAYRCDAVSGCENFGDQMSGAAAMFYFALATDRIFVLQWVHPIDMSAHFFDTNTAWYPNVNQLQFDSNLLRSSYKSRYIMANGPHYGQLGSQLVSFRVAQLRRQSDVLHVSTDKGKATIKATFQLTSMYPALHTYLPGLPEYKTNLDLSVYLSAAMRIIFGQLKADFRKIIDDFIEQHWPDEKQLKIGVQVQVCKNRDRPCPLVGSKPAQCFAKQVASIVRARNQSAVVLLVVADEDEGDKKQIDLFKKALLAEGLDTVDTLDAAVRKQPEEKTKKLAAAVFDWHLLSRMDWLVITHGRFGETASTLSLKPTYRLEGRNADGSCKFAWFNPNSDRSDGL